MTAQHSRGPWVAAGISVLSDTGRTLAVAVKNNVQPLEVAEANARLMAAAYLLPEMVQVITNLLDAVTTCSPSECKGCRDAVLAGGAVLKQYEGDA